MTLRLNQIDAIDATRVARIRPVGCWKVEGEFMEFENYFLSDRGVALPLVDCCRRNAPLY